ncbi:hypothetical protein BESB_072140 [Besnoitia besnoiti]|uniref:CDK5 regulatory subunit-associated protein 3 n=1 Tax=Besnoitia besnoiti TaxID=94643 RepID=A0A2A9MFA0_BESBE|nr:uncharacterized protein BESB_072140 [Besnoitia besnoiti]PFH34062.1 hypothetical protein BESB_072140 [Besnoitia besnoiti]
MSFGGGIQQQLDVPCQKVADWLLCRRQLAENWVQLLKAAHAHVEEAAAQGVGEEKAAEEFLKENRHELNYLKIKELVSILSQSPQSSGVSVLGLSFGSALLRRWRALQRAMERGNLHIVDMSRWFCRHLHDGIPALQRSIQGKQKQISDGGKRKQELLRTAQEAESAHAALCEKYGIPSAAGGHSGSLALSDLEERILLHVNQVLPGRLNQVEDLLVAEGAAMVEVYRRFRAYQRSQNVLERGEKVPAPGPEGSEDGDGFLPMLRFVARRGNAPAAEALRALASSADSRAHEERGNKREAKTEGVGESAAFSIEVEAEGEGAGNREDSHRRPTASAHDSGVEILSVEADGQACAASLFESRLCRRALLDDVAELHAFLYQRLEESDQGGGAGRGKKASGKKAAGSAAGAVTQLTSLPEDLSISESQLDAWLGTCTTVEGLLGGRETLELLQLKQSQAHMAKLVSQFAQARSSAWKPRGAAAQLDKRVAELQTEMKEEQSKLSALKAEARGLRKAIEEALGVVVKGTKVTLVGMQPDKLA